MMPEPLTIESLARAIHEDQQAALLKAIRREQARLMFERIMR